MKRTHKILPGLAGLWMFVGDASYREAGLVSNIHNSEYIVSQLADIRIYMLDTAKYQVTYSFLLVIFPFIWLNHSRYSHSSTRKIRRFLGRLLLQFP